MSLTRTLLPTMMLAAGGLSTALHAQSQSLTNADIVRLVAAHVSDRTVVAVLHEAKATQFDLGEIAVGYLSVSGVSPVVIAAMRQASAPSSRVPGENAAPQQSPSPGGQTLAGASAEAGKVLHTWEQSKHIGSHTPGSPALARTSDGTKSEGTTTSVNDEGWWRQRMASLRDQLAMDKMACEPLAAKIRALDAIYAGYVFYDKDGTAKINTAAAAVVETKLVDARNEQRQCVAKVTLAQTAIATVEEEARRLGVLPGWLR
jgi:hypothetical protein